MSVTTCGQLSTTTSNYLNQLTTSANSIGDQYTSFENSMKEYVSGMIGDTSYDLSSILTSMDSSVSSSVSEIMQNIKNYSGTCLDSILSPIQSIVDDVTGFGQSIIGDVGSTSGGLTQIVTNALSKFLDISGLFTALGISDLVTVLDNLFGCLSSASCLPLGQIQSQMSQVTSIIKKYGLTDSGTLDLTTWFSNKIDVLLNLPEKIYDYIVNGFSNIWNKVTTFFTDIQSKFQNIIDGFKNFNTSTITGFLNNMGAIGGLVSGVVSLVSGSGAKSATPVKTGTDGIWNVVDTLKSATIRGAQKRRG